MQPRKNHRTPDSSTVRRGSVAVAGNAPVFTSGFALRAGQRFPVRAVATDDHRRARGAVVALARHDGDHVDAGLELGIDREFEFGWVRRLAVGLVEDLAR